MMIKSIQFRCGVHAASAEELASLFMFIKRRKYNTPLYACVLIMRWRDPLNREINVCII